MSSPRLISIAAELSAPPSSPSCFRDVTLRATIKKYEVVAVAPREALDPYNDWFKRYGLWDYLTDLLPEGVLREDETEIEILGGPGTRLTAHNLHMILRHL